MNEDVAAKIANLREHLNRIPTDSPTARLGEGISLILDGYERERANNLILRAENAELRELVKELAP